MMQPEKGQVVVINIEPGAVNPIAAEGEVRIAENLATRQSRVVTEAPFRSRRIVVVRPGWWWCSIVIVRLVNLQVLQRRV